ncbi:divergent polysaccharide deacetylase family protein [Devosia sp. MC1541]|uniref:divergent polysaccharide deacetylase family protein n=1 Tax=Devosia sp. MC1541 TaxID=2725264 RepID=UPI00145F537A|nr:divergent polysaccharide deacetylase family protein [Devosia sp. MC1541]
MANDLSTPLRGRKHRVDGGRHHFPLARTLFGVSIVILLGALGRIVLVDDPLGGRPMAEVAITSTRDANAVANAVAVPNASAGATSPVTITADDQQFPAGQVPLVPYEPAETTPRPSLEVSLIGTGVLPELAEETVNGIIPRMSPTGLGPFDAYRRPFDEIAPNLAKIAIVVTGLGINEQGSMNAIDQLPADITLAFAPYGRSLVGTVNTARASGHEVMLEIPLEPFDYPQNDPGPHTMLTGETPRANLDKLFWLMSRFGGYFSVMNNMGARFTASAGDMSPVMEELGLRGLGYLDDGSSNRSVAGQLAEANNVPFTRATTMLDANPSRPAILSAIASLEAQAMETGSAIGIISALPISVQTVSEWAQELDAKGIVLVPASALMK